MKCLIEWLWHWLWTDWLWLCFWLTDSLILTLTDSDPTLTSENNRAGTAEDTRILQVSDADTTAVSSEKQGSCRFHTCTPKHSKAVSNWRKILRLIRAATRIAKSTTPTVSDVTEFARTSALHAGYCNLGLLTTAKWCKMSEWNGFGKMAASSSKRPESDNLGKYHGTKSSVVGRVRLRPRRHFWRTGQLCEKPQTKLQEMRQILMQLTTILPHQNLFQKFPSVQLSERCGQQLCLHLSMLQLYAFQSKGSALAMPNFSDIRDQMDTPKRHRRVAPRWKFCEKLLVANQSFSESRAKS